MLTGSSFNYQNKHNYYSTLKHRKNKTKGPKKDTNKTNFINSNMSTTDFRLNQIIIHKSPPPHTEKTALKSSNKTKCSAWKGSLGFCFTLIVTLTVMKRNDLGVVDKMSLSSKDDSIKFPEMHNVLDNRFGLAFKDNHLRYINYKNQGISSKDIENLIKLKNKHKTSKNSPNDIYILTPENLENRKKARAAESAKRVAAINRLRKEKQKNSNSTRISDSNGTTMNLPRKRHTKLDYKQRKKKIEQANMEAKIAEQNLSKQLGLTT